MNEDRIYCDSEKKHDFVMLFDVTDGNPNGDPDAGNLPRVDPETMQGLVTDVCLKRKVRDFVDAVKGDEKRYKVYVQNKGVALNTLHKRAYTALEMKSSGTKQKREDVERTRRWMCDNFFDIRMFGAVMTTEINCGQVRGPIQMTFARSISPIVPLDVSITRVAITREKDAEVVEGENGATGGKRTEMGRKALLPYGLYVSHGFYSAHFAAQTGVDGADLGLFWRALQEMWDLDRSASRGMMVCRGLYVFTHDNKLGKAPAHELFERVKVVLNDGTDAPRRFADYSVTVDGDSLPDGVVLTRLVG